MCREGSEQILLYYRRSGREMRIRFMMFAAAYVLALEA